MSDDDLRARVREIVFSDDNDLGRDMQHRFTFHQIQNMIDEMTPDEMAKIVEQYGEEEACGVDTSL